MIPRDMFDIATAAREGPAALASALNMLPEDRVSSNHMELDEGRDDIRRDYLKDERLWISPEHRIEATALVDRAVDAIHSHRYQRLQVDVDADDIAKTIRTRPLPPGNLPADRPGRGHH